MADSASFHPGLWAKRLNWITLTQSHSREHAATDVDFKAAARVSPDSVFPGTTVASEQIRTGLVLTKKLAKYMIEASGSCIKSSSEVKECLARMSEIYHQQKGTGVDKMQDYVALCFEAATSLALLTESLAVFATQIQHDIGEPMLEMSRRSAEHHEQIVQTKDDLAKQLIAKRLAMVRQRAMCRNNWNKTRLNLGIITDQQFKSELIDFEATPKTMISGIVNRAAKNPNPKNANGIGNGLVQAQESFQTLEKMVEDLNAEESLIRTSKLPKLLNVLENLENHRLECVETSMTKYSQSLQRFVTIMSNTSQKLADRLILLDRKKYIDDWTTTFEKTVRKGAEALQEDFQVYLGLPCPSNEFTYAIRGDDAVPTQAMMENLKMNFEELSDIGEMTFNTMKSIPIELDQDILEAKLQFEKKNRPAPEIPKKPEKFSGRSLPSRKPDVLQKLERSSEDDLSP